MSEKNKPFEIFGKENSSNFLKIQIAVKIRLCFKKI